MNPMSYADSSTLMRDLKMLVVIASYGDKNITLLREVIRRYRKMDLFVDIVVISNAPKDLGSDIQVVVGLPSENPWSLPFAHKPIFAQKVEAYDLFLYTEDDMGMTETNVRAFLQVTPSSPRTRLLASCGMKSMSPEPASCSMCTAGSTGNRSPVANGAPIQLRSSPTNTLLSIC